MEKLRRLDYLPADTRAPHLPVALLAALALAAAVLLGGCLAEEGLGEGGGGGVGQVTWNDVAAIFWNPAGCGQCHPPVGSGPATTSLDYAPLINNTSGSCGATSQMITIGDRNLSCLYLAVTGADGTSMASFLSVSQQEEIGAWIDQGAPGP